MGFMIHSTDSGRVPATEYLPAGAITPKAGMALTQTGGLLVSAVGAQAPSYISADADSVALGDKVTISADGLSITATAGGPAEVVYMDGTEKGSMCRVRFGGN